MDLKDREGSEDTRQELKILKWYGTGNVIRNGEITFFSARGQAIKFILNIQTATNEGSGKAPCEVDGEVEQFRNS
jgi:hypothetical protein